MSLKLFGFIYKLRGQRFQVSNKSLLGIMHAATFKGKTRACKSNLKVYVLVFNSYKGLGG